MKKVLALLAIILIPIMAFAANEELDVSSFELWGVKPFTPQSGQYDVRIYNTYVPPEGSDISNHANEFLTDGSMIPLDLDDLPVGGNDSADGHVPLFSVVVSGTTGKNETVKLGIVVRPFMDIENKNAPVGTHFVASYTRQYGNDTKTGNLDGLTASQGDVAGKSWKEDGISIIEKSTASENLEYQLDVQVNRHRDQDKIISGTVYAMTIDVSLIVEVE